MWKYAVLGTAAAIIACNSVAQTFTSPTTINGKPLTPTQQKIVNSVMEKAQVIDHMAAAVENARAQGKSDTDIIRSARDAAAYNLKDPDSANFRNLRIIAYDGGHVVCGEINGKNSMGGYAGYAQFVAGPSSAYVKAPPQDALEDDDKLTTNIVVGKVCRGS